MSLPHAAPAFRSSPGILTCSTARRAPRAHTAVPRWGREGMEGIKVLLSVLQEAPLPRAEGLKFGSHAQGEEII